MSEHRGLDHAGVERDCIQDWHFCGARDGDFAEMPKKYRTIVVDPPWEYREKPRHWRLNRGTAPKSDAGEYGRMALCDLAALPVADWAEPRSHLYLWTTNQVMEEAYGIARAWGFEVKTILTWVKNRIGMGYYFRNNTEHVLFATRGGLQTLRNDQPTAFHAPRGKHSEKPAAFYDMVESMSPAPYLDVFARKHRFNWDVYGNEVYSDIPLVGGGI